MQKSYRQNYLWSTIYLLCKLQYAESIASIEWQPPPRSVEQNVWNEVTYPISWEHQVVACKLTVDGKIPRTIHSSSCSHAQRSWPKSAWHLAQSCWPPTEDSGESRERGFLIKHSPQFTLFTRIKTSCLRYETLLKSWMPSRKTVSTTGRCSERKWSVTPYGTNSTFRDWLARRNSLRLHWA